MFVNISAKKYAHPHSKNAPPRCILFSVKGAKSLLPSGFLVLYLPKMQESPLTADFFIVSIIKLFYGGGEGNCTPVSKNCPNSIYACILYFKSRRA